MYTQCPSCNVIFSMTEDDIDAHQGLVRCGRCREVFNASWNLVDSIPNQQPAGLQTETLRPTEETLATPETTPAGVDDIVLVDADTSAFTDSPGTELELEQEAVDQMDLGEQEVDAADWSVEQIAEEEPAVATDEPASSVNREQDFSPPEVELTDEIEETATVSDLDEPEPTPAEADIDVVEVERVESTQPPVETDLTAEVVAAPQADVPGQSEPEEVDSDDAVALPTDEITTEVEDSPRSTVESEHDDETDSSVLDDIDWSPAIEESTDESGLEELEEATESAEPFITTVPSADAVIDQTDESVAMEAVSDDADSVLVIDDETNLSEAEDISSEEKLAINELSSLLEEDASAEESVLIAEEVEAEDPNLIPSSEPEPTLNELEPSKVVATASQDEATVVTDLEDFDAEVTGVTDEEIALDTLDPLATGELVAEDEELKTQAEAFAAEDVSDSPLPADDEVTEDRPDRAERPATAEPMFPDVEPEEIIIEAPTKLWKIGEGPDVDAEDTTSEAAASAPAGAAQGKQKPRSQWVRMPYSVRLLAWSLGAILLLFGLMWQIKDHYLVDLAQIPALREPLTYMCKYLWCTVPPRTDIKAIDLVGTNVDPHPVTPGALRVSASLINRAKFEQQFPLLEITLTDKEGNVVGRRTYLPHEYRGGAPNRMLPNVLERANFDLAQPAESAVGYEIQLVAR